MSKGKTFSITVPFPLFDQIEKEAKENGISRSKHVYNIIQQYYSEPVKLPPDKIIERCGLENEQGVCQYYEVECPIKNALSQRQCDHFQDPEISNDIEESKGK